LTTKNAVDQIEKELPDNAEIQHLVEFMRASQRGVA
jgi:acyl-[acyl carrier protein]--UDP-N-acetylglucosamine O-acyltransferase